MREILFKAKRRDNGEWVEGYYYKMCETTYAFAEDYEKNPALVHHYILFERMTDWGMPNQMYQTEVDPSTPCQYTGLPDKYGRKIWQNDIVKYLDEITGKYKTDIVEWNETHAAFVRLHKSEMGLQYLFIDEAVANKCEVIGNIFDNPELLKSAQYAEGVKNE